MVVTTITCAVILMVTGVVAYLASGMASITALIPTFAGTTLLLFGLIALKDKLRKHVMHGAAFLALLGIAGAAPGFAKLPALFAGSAERPIAVVVQCIMATVLLVFLVLCIRSFINARRQRLADQAAVG